MKQSSTVQLYQEEVCYLRRRRESEPWPGKDVTDRAESLYPNVAAEIIASNYSMAAVQDHAHISYEIIAAVVEDREPLSIREKWSMARLWQCNPRYLFADTLQVIDPHSKKGKRRLRELTDAMKLVESLDYFRKHHVESVRRMLEGGKMITYAHYRCAMMELQYAVCELQESDVRKTRTALLLHDLY